MSYGPALTEAARQNHVEIIRLLMGAGAGADPDQYHFKPRDMNPVEAASKRGYKECVALMFPKASERPILATLFEVFEFGKSGDPPKTLSF